MDSLLLPISGELAQLVVDDQRASFELPQPAPDSPVWALAASCVDTVLEALTIDYPEKNRRAAVQAGVALVCSQLLRSIGFCFVWSGEIRKIGTISSLLEILDLLFVVVLHLGDFGLHGISDGLQLRRFDDACCGPVGWLVWLDPLFFSLKFGGKQRSHQV